MREIKTIFGKEMARIFREKKMVFSVFFLPVISMIGMVMLMGYLANNMTEDIQNHQTIIYVENESKEFRAFLDKQDLHITIEQIGEQKERGEVEEAIRQGDADLLIEFPKQFDEQIIAYTNGDALPQVKTFFNPSEDYSYDAQEIISNALEMYRQEKLQERLGDLDSIAVFTVNSDNEEMIVQDDQRASGKAIGTMLPYFVTLLLFAGAMGIGVDMVAGEKERGTMASLLMTPIKRSSIALGKVFALMSLSGLSAAISIVSMVVCMPMMMDMGSGESMSMTLTLSQGLMLGGLVIAVAFLYATIIALISVFAKDIKEATSYIMPVYMLVMVLGIMTMFQTGKTAEVAFFVPIYNTAVVMGGILAQETTMFQYAVTFGITMGISLLLIGLIVRAFKSEKVMSA
jgi:hypothetical protein